MILILLFCFITLINSFTIKLHPLENKIAYIYGLKNINKIDKNIENELFEIFTKHPLIILKDIENVKPIEFLNFVKKFDKDHDTLALNYPEYNEHQFLQPFDQFPDCKHVAPRGNIELSNYHNIANINIKPYDSFINNYLWHSDILGHEYKLTNVVTGFYILEQPQIGGDTDFISGERIYENLNDKEKISAGNILIEINRRKFVTNSIKIDYAGINSIEEYEENEGNTKIRILFAPDNYYEKPRILIQPTFFEKVVGWNIKEFRNWIRNFMNDKVLPYRISIQWKKNDLAIFNNRRFIHSSTPARNYLDNQESNKRLLLQTFIPTKKPLLGIIPSEKNVYACYNNKWISDMEKSIISAHDYIKFIKNITLENNETIIDNKYYVLKR